MEEKTLYGELAALSREGNYPFHMPGHKRNPRFADWKLPMDQDITEIDGFDNLHHATGLLLSRMEALSDLYGTKHSYYSVNGSTGALLAAISAAAPRGSCILMGRNCHKAVYHGVYLRELEPVFLYPPQKEGQEGYGEILPGQVEEAFLAREREGEKPIAAVVITSPTYEGVISDIEQIAELCHRHGAVLIVDEAHGAHLKFSPALPASAVELGADLVIHSLHKTLPALTQTAALHLCSDRVEESLVRHFLEIYLTSSPSYILMESLDRCVSFLRDEGEEAFEAYISLLTRAREELTGLKHIRLITPRECFAYDITKLLFRVDPAFGTGHAVAERLRLEFHIEVEMESRQEVLALSSVGDSREGLERLVMAMKALDQEAAGDEKCKIQGASLPAFPVRKMGLSEAADAPLRAVPLLLSAGKISGEFVYLYPPGIPLITPGERIETDMVDFWRQCEREGQELNGLRDISGKTILTVRQDIEE